MIAKVLRRLSNELKYYIRKRKYKKRPLQRTDYTIISSNCIGGSIYKDFNLPFNSPTIGLFIHGKDYVKFCTNLHYYLSMSLTKAEVSKWAGVVNYPVGIIGDIEIHFLHYDSFEAARDKWEKRRARVNYDNIYYIMTDRDFSTYSDMIEFDKIEGRKVVFSSKNHKGISSLVYCYKYEGAGEVGMLPLFMEYSDYMDVVDWLDG